MNSHALRKSGFLGPEFNEFLFESIGADQYGRPLSVVSALARLDLDAWAEAAKLARLPREIAANKLSALLRRFTELPQVVQDSQKTAERLVALLPERAAVGRQSPEPPLLPEEAKKLGGSAVVFLLIMVVLVGMHLLASAVHPPAALQGAPESARVTVPSPHQ